MNQVLSTTTPVAPTGAAPTEIPLGLSGTIAPQLAPANIVPTAAPIFTQGWGAFIGSFQITAGQPVGQLVYSWNTDSPLPNHDYSGTDNTPVFNMPRDLIQAFYSRQSKVDWKLRFKPVKVSDCRVSIDFILSYGSTGPPFDTMAYANESFHKHFDEQDDEFEITIPMYWVTKNIPTYGFPEGPLFTRKPAFYPFTNLSCHIRNTYQPNLMQPNAFNILVFATPIVREVAGIHGPTPLNNNYNPTSIPVGGFPIPYFMN